MKKATSIILAAAVAATLVAPVTSNAQGIADEAAVLQELNEVEKILKTLPDLEGKSEEAVKKLLEANPEYGRKIDAAEKKAREVVAKLGAEVDAVALEAALRDLESIEELRDKTEEETEQILNSNPDVRQRVSAAGRRVAAASGAPPASEPESGDAVAESAESAFVPDDIGEVVVLPDGTRTNIIDDVFFGELQWVYGGEKFGDAEKDGPLISGLAMARDGLSFKYLRDLSCWGLGYGDANALACLFVQDNDGNWVGGKFEWISTSRTSRSFTNIFEGYNGWNLSNVPKTTTAAFVIVSKDGKKRSNVITAIWER